MKKAILFILFLIHLKTYAQNLTEVHVGIGYRSHITGMEAYSDILSYYNNNRPWLDNNFSTSPFMGGFEIGLEHNEKNYGLSLLKLYFVRNSKVSKGTDPSGDDFKRRLTATIWGLELIDAWWTPLHIKKWNLGGGLMPVGTGKLRIFNKLNNEKRESLYIFTNPSFDWLGRLVNQRHYYTNLHLDASKNDVWGGNIHFQLFYTIGPRREYELHLVNKEINPNTYQELYKRTLLKINYWGLKIMYTI